MLPGLTAQGNAASSDAGVCVGAALGCTYSTVDGAASRAEHEAKCPHAIAQRAVERERAAWRTALRKLENRVEQLEAGRPAASPAPASASQQPSLSYGNQDGHAALYASSFADAPADDDARASWQMTRVGGAVRGHAGSVCALAASCAGDWVLSGSLDRTVRLWRRRSAADGGGSGAEASSYLASEPAPLVELTHATGHAGVVCAVAAHPRRAGTAYTGSFDGTLRVWEVDVGRGTLACAACVNVGSKVLSLVPALHGDELYAGTARGDVFMFAVPGDGTSAPERRAVFEAHAGVDVRALALAERQGATAVLFTAGGDACVKAWRADPVRLAAGGVTLATLTGHGNPVRALALASHMQLLFSGSSDATIRVWFVGGLTGMGGVGAPRCLHVLRGHRDSVWSLAIDSTSCTRGQPTRACAFGHCGKEPRCWRRQRARTSSKAIRTSFGRSASWRSETAATPWFSQDLRTAASLRGRGATTTPVLSEMRDGRAGNRQPC